VIWNRYEKQRPIHKNFKIAVSNPTGKGLNGNRFPMSIRHKFNNFINRYHHIMKVSNHLKLQQPNGRRQTALPVVANATKRQIARL